MSGPHQVEDGTTRPNLVPTRNANARCSIFFDSLGLREARLGPCPFLIGQASNAYAGSVNLRSAPDRRGGRSDRIFCSCSRYSLSHSHHCPLVNVVVSSFQSGGDKDGCRERRIVGTYADTSHPWGSTHGSSTKFTLSSKRVSSECIVHVDGAPLGLDSRCGPESSGAEPRAASNRLVRMQAVRIRLCLWLALGT